jgi:hypothetical protein
VSVYKDNLGKIWPKPTLFDFGPSLYKDNLGKFPKKDRFWAKYLRTIWENFQKTPFLGKISKDNLGNFLKIHYFSENSIEKTPFYVFQKVKSKKRYSLFFGKKLSLFFKYVQNSLGQIAKVTFF